MRARGHAIVPSASLIPENDPTTLFTGSGMQPMIPYLLGEPHPQGRRIADAQRSFRAQDMPEVGDNRHTTFFEMLGNWSFGDYFKSEQIPWMWEFLTRELGLEPGRLFFSCYGGNDGLAIPKDEESARLWQGLFDAAGVTGTHIFFYGDEHNWWSRTGAPGTMPVGEPGGPDTEIFWDFGPSQFHKNSSQRDKKCHINCDCGRYLEIGNNVFMEYQKTKSGFTKLKQRNVDFGGGLERIMAAVGDTPDIFMIDVFASLRIAIRDLSGRKYGEHESDTNAFRAIMDHIRAATFLIADGAIPSNKDQGYFTRRLVRRAIRFANTLGVKKSFCGDLAQKVIDTYAAPYPYLLGKSEVICDELTREEQKFQASVGLGLEASRRMMKSKKTGDAVSASEAFDLYQSYGFPLEMTLELAREKGLAVDEVGFADEMKKHQTLSKIGMEQKFKGGLADHSAESTRFHTATHLLHQALRTVLGTHVEQRGSNITRARMRFDFTHPQKMTPSEIKRVEDLMNRIIQKDLPVHYEILAVDEAKRRGALGFFEDAYAQMGGKIKVYFVGDEERGYFSKEICGGPHVQHTGEIKGIQIQKEEAVQAGVRRIKATFTP